MFTLDERLANDTVMLGDFELSQLLLMNDKRYPWCILVPKRKDINEIYQLSEAEQNQLNHESVLLGRTLMALFKGDSLNVAALGNVVSQLHVHHVVRFHGDSCWPGPVWGVGQAISYSESELDELQQKITTPLLGKLGFQ
ncbi:HIT domain-containing protein [Psychrobium sp. 1_MG-2023]|uniref:HIT domain-containing protein n=1 Tax=Psychrobium sp. 1_MG-2023 TaxID=3062624 RepID=UPI000C321143|nr:HIT domain-containing protein [Psychrobium sp. 1_MG-2023]MDP2560466.1 HIT domain-containing protein [Psychrobium sp. 1_MG-2023]PKF57874.1 hypothetical protein CW748_04980 [Alteromonadales bacterium alter-6D02]